MSEPPLEIRRATKRELPAMVRALGQGPYFRNRLRRQRRGHGILLVAWLGKEPVGDVYLWLGQAEEREIREHLAGVPLVTHLEVHERIRNRGVGTRLLDHAERLLHERGHQRVALGVTPENKAAIDLYRRLAYEEWGRGLVETEAELFREDGMVERQPEKCQIFVKDLVGRLAGGDLRYRIDASAGPAVC